MPGQGDAPGALLDREADLLGLAQAGGDVVPVDDIPKRSEEVGLHVLVLQVVGVLPSIDGQQGQRALAVVALVVVDLLLLTDTCNESTLSEVRVSAGPG